MTSSKQPSVVLDTNVRVSGLIFGGQPGKLLQLFKARQLLIVTSEELLTELRRVITQKFSGYIPRLELLEDSIRQDAELVRLGGQTVIVCRDPDDNKVIETALVGKCSHIISGDKDLLTLGSYEDITIMTPAEFLQMLASNYSTSGTKSA